MNKIKKYLMDYYNSLDKKQKMILVIILVLILSIVYFAFIKNNYREGEIDYNNVDIQDILESSEIIYERGKIKTLDEILNNILKIYYNSYYIDTEEVSIKDLYNNSVYTSYTNKISYSKFKNKLNSIYQNVLEGEQVSSLDNNTYIKNVFYSYEYDMYLIELKGKNHNPYIGIRLYTTENVYKITYIEE